jgi:hypothetical protein
VIAEMEGAGLDQAETLVGELEPCALAEAAAGDQRAGHKLSRDPLGEFANGVGYGQDVNLYAYVNNSPLNRIDPLGLTGTCTSLDACASDSALCAEIGAGGAPRLIPPPVGPLIPTTEVPTGPPPDIAPKQPGGRDCGLLYALCRRKAGVIRCMGEFLLCIARPMPDL